MLEIPCFFFDSISKGLILTVQTCLTLQTDTILYIYILQYTVTHVCTLYGKTYGHDVTCLYI